MEILLPQKDLYEYDIFWSLGMHDLLLPRSCAGGRIAVLNVLRERVITLSEDLVSSHPDGYSGDPHTDAHTDQHAGNAL